MFPVRCPAHSRTLFPWTRRLPNASASAVAQSTPSPKRNIVSFCNKIRLNFELILNSSGILHSDSPILRRISRSTSVSPFLARLK